MSLLGQILDAKRAEVAAARACPAPLARSHANLDVVHALERREGAPLRLIAEVKFKSPSAGALSRALDAPSRALAYARAGASMVSVLCDGPFFGGSWDDLRRARQALDREGYALPLLAKEFVVDPIQIDWAHVHGADAILLIVRVTSTGGLASFVEAARARGIEPFVEVSDEEELDAALESGARVIGVNARDLDTLAMDGVHAARVVSAIPPDRVSAYLSGVKDEADVRRVAASPAHAALVGETLMRADDPGPLLKALTGACAGGSGEG